VWAVVAMSLGLIATACGGAHTSSNPTLPPVNQSVATATRHYLSGPGGYLLHLDAVAKGVSPSISSSTCRVDAASVVSIIAGTPVTSTTVPLPDDVLAELFADEQSSLEKTLAACGGGTNDHSLMAGVITVRDQVRKRLAADGMSS
jgi:hypothetical protein